MSVENASRKDSSGAGTGPVLELEILGDIVFLFLQELCLNLAPQSAKKDATQ
ncbi:hypothetical protein [Thalassoroseus pseudoceratinae]|uniref:hypothetical protein n=1 Tax=Thalassoroseus pseudoceratinae TaxID=2713176 RepID=UPI00142196C9|nr:hypothetical protein [Thalassoroseus pseudoceratinae]